MNRLNACLLITMLLTLAACTSSPTSDTLPKHQIIQDTAQPPETWLQQAHRSGSPKERSTLMLKAASAFSEEKKWTEANELFSMITPYDLDAAGQREYVKTGLTLANNQSDMHLARQILEYSHLPGLMHTNIEEQMTLTDLIASAQTLVGNYSEAAYLRIQSSNLFTGGLYTHNHENIWKNLRSTPLDTLTQLETESGNDYLLLGWLTLAKAIRLNLFSLDQQISALFAWQSQWPNHPAAQNLPGELALMATLPSLRPQHIALALPLTGKLANAGNAVLQGFMASFYQDEYRLTNQTKITVIDTAQISSSYELADKLETEAPDLVIGPLNKEWVAELATNPSYTRRTLALNYASESPSLSRKNFFEFGLAFEDELNQLITQFNRQGVQQLKLYCPDSSWGKRVCDQARSEWMAQEGNLADQTYYNPASEHTKTIEESLKIDESKLRKREIQTLLGDKPEFNPRRRQDIDAILLIADPINGRQIKPLLSFFFAGDIPVYSLSNIYTGQSDTLRDQDLNGIRFTESPWVLQSANALKSRVAKEWPELNANYTRFFALGADTYLLAPRLPLLDELNEIIIPGNTGMLYTPHSNQIHRKLEWAIFNGGEARISAL